MLVVVERDRGTMGERGLLVVERDRGRMKEPPELPVPAVKKDGGDWGTEDYMCL